jgi:hypothetical protein
MATEESEAIDRLYGLPLDEFTAERDELAARLRRDGDRDAAAEVKRLRKPGVAAWALNQVRRNNPRQVEELIETGSRLRDAQEQLLSGGGREPLDQAAEDERRLVAELARHAERELVAAGRGVSAAVHERLRDTLRAVATDEEARAGLSAGRLLRDYTPSGLGALLDAESGGARRPDGALGRRARQLEGRLEQAREKQRELEEEASQARRDLRTARREAARAAAALERAEAAEEQAQTRAREAGDRTAELEDALGELRE